MKRYSYLFQSDDDQRCVCQKMYLMGSRLNTRLFCANENEQGYWDPLSAPKLDFNECYYKVLETDPNVGVKELKKAYYKVVFKYHPDNKETNAEKELCNKQMMVINGAYRVLKDPVTRSQYDKQRAFGLFGANAGVKGSGRNDPSHDASNSSKTRNSVQQQEQQSQGSIPKKEANPGSPSAAKFWNSFFEQQQQQQQRRSAVTEEDVSYAYDDIEAEAEEYFRGSVDYRDSGRRQYSQDDERDGSMGWGRSGSRTSADSTSSDGSLTGLLALYRSLKLERKRKEEALLADPRDWGQEKDLQEVKKRLNEIQDIKNLARRISDLEDEIENMTYSSERNDPYSSNPNFNSYRSPSDERSRWDPRVKSQSPYEPQPQPQRQKEPPRRQQSTVESDDYYDELLRKWRQQQLQQGANSDLRSQSTRSGDLWADFDFSDSSFRNSAVMDSNTNQPSSWRNDMEKRRNPKGVKKTMNDDDEDDEWEEVEDMRPSGDGAVMDELQILFKMWKDKK